MLLTIKNIIALARELTDGLKVSETLNSQRNGSGIIFRRELLQEGKGRHDAEGEEYLQVLAEKLRVPDFRLVSVKHGVLPATRIRLAQLRGREAVDILFEEFQDTASTRQTSLYSYVDNTREKPSVVYRSDLKLCWLRFAIAKELMHLYSDTAGRAGQSKADSIARTALVARQRVSRSKNSFWDVAPSLDSPLDDETAVIFLTMEVMFAWRLREQFLKLREATERIDTLQYFIAKAFMIPRTFVDHFCQDYRQESNYSAVSYSLNREYDTLSPDGKLSWLPRRP